VTWESELAVWEEFNDAVYGRLRLDLINRRLQGLPLPDGARVLDVGCGTGESALALGLRGANVTAIDQSPAMLRRASEHAQAAGVNWTAIEGDASDLDHLELGSFDLILCHNLLAYVPNGQEVVGALSDRLRTAGQLSLVVSNSLGEPVRFALENNDLVEALRWAIEQPQQRQGKTFDHPMRLHTRTELADWAERSGMRVRGVWGINVIAPYLDDQFKEANYQELIALEEVLGSQSAYVDMSVHLHLLAVRA
jgi:S-adenosylmethionine-dependent methyltransferase